MRVQNGEKKMTTIVLNNGYITSGISGGDKVLLDEAERLSKSQHIILVMPDIAKSNNRGLDAITYRAKSNNRGLLLFLEYIKRMFRIKSILNTIHADMILCSSGFFDIIPSIQRGIPVRVYLFHTIPKHRVMSHLIQRFTFRWMLRAEKVYVCNSIETGKLLKAGFSREQIEIITPQIDALAIKRAEPIGDHQAVFVGRMVENKGVWDIVRVMKQINLTLVMIGTGPELDKLKRYAIQNNINKRIHFTGYVDDEIKYRYLKAGKVLIMPSYEEGYCITIAEAICAGTDVVAYELPHYRECFGDKPIYCETGNVSQLTTKLKEYEKKDNK